jgi:hypothetical protein
MAGLCQGLLLLHRLARADIIQARRRFSKQYSASKKAVDAGLHGTPTTGLIPQVVACRERRFCVRNLYAKFTRAQLQISARIP